MDIRAWDGMFSLDLSMMEGFKMVTAEQMAGAF